jgi:hypothetical protein
MSETDTLGPTANFDVGSTSTTAYYRLRATGPNFYFIEPFNCTSWDFSRRFDQDTIRPDVARTYGKLLTDAEKAYLRKINCQPTRDGIRVCGRWHARSTRCITLTPHFRIRFDRRVPCWRSGRWKSLT